MGDIGQLRRHFEVLAGGDLAGPSLERLAQVAGRVARAGQDGADSPVDAPPSGTGTAGERDDHPTG